MSPLTYNTARDLRATIEKAKSGNASIAWLSRFPKNCCNFAANLLLIELADAKFKPLRRMIGTILDDRGDDVANHVWVQCGDVAIDITADQYGQPTVIAESQSGWHLSLTDVKPFIPKHDLEEGVSEEEIGRLRELYKDALHELAPFREGLAKPE